MTYHELMNASGVPLSFEYARKPGARFTAYEWEPERVLSLQREGYIINVKPEYDA